MASSLCVYRQRAAITSAPRSKPSGTFSYTQGCPSNSAYSQTLCRRHLSWFKSDLSHTHTTHIHEPHAHTHTHTPVHTDENGKTPRRSLLSEPGHSPDFLTEVSTQQPGHPLFGCIMSHGLLQREPLVGKELLLGVAYQCFSHHVLVLSFGRSRAVEAEASE